MEIKQTNHCSNQRLKIKGNLVRMRSLLRCSLRVMGGSDVMSRKYCPWSSRAWYGSRDGTGPLSAQTRQGVGFVQDSEMGWPWGEMSRCFEDAVSCPPASLSAPLSPEPGSMAQPSCSLDPRGHRPAAISPGAVPLHSSCWEIVKILLDMLSKVCKT